VQGEVSAAWHSAEEPAKRGRAIPSAAQKAGLAYEKKIRRWAFEGNWKGSILCSPWFCYLDDSARRQYCQPDLLFDEGPAKRVVICEVKLRWHPDAWWQIERLYKPVLQKVFPDRTLVSLCVTRSFDPHEVGARDLDPPLRLVDDLMSCSPSSFSVLVVR
jgi:hypothetical protein